MSRRQAHARPRAGQVTAAAGGGRLRFLQIYYLITPLFLMPDWIWGVGIRIGCLEGSPWRYPYYAMCFGCGLLCSWRQALAPLIGLAESMLNIALVIFSVMLPLIALMQSTPGDDVVAMEAFAWPRLVTLCISGLVFTISYTRCHFALMRQNARAAWRRGE